MDNSFVLILNEVRETIELNKGRNKSVVDFSVGNDYLSSDELKCNMMFKDSKGPIESYEFGKFIICGQEHYGTGQAANGAGKDIRITSAGVSGWEDRKGHRLTPEMITGVFRNDVHTLIIGLGAYGALECPKAVMDYIKANGIGEILLEKTPDACRLYNELFRKGKGVALLAHGTC